MLQNHKMYKHFWPLVTKSKNVIVGYLVPYTNKVVPFDSCNMGTSDLPDMYAQSPRAAGPRAEGIHIRQITSAHVTTIM